jgi:hypothetical protein
MTYGFSSLYWIYDPVPVIIKSKNDAKLRKIRENVIVPVYVGVR